ncbi:MAG: hypothetical protein M1820_010627 [Bogoriella megaspora]|nr:MAG: hypothetical protein M1820_010627 [Bogoriella megaspora]
MPYKIAIIGAGPAGCMLGGLLHQSDISCTIFEGERSPNFRSQGGTLDLHTKTGQAALKKGGLYDEFTANARFDGEAMNWCDKKLLSYVKFSGGKEGNRYGRPEIDRPVLRQILCDSLPKGFIKWGRRLRHVDENLNLYFDHGVETVSDVQPHYSGISGLALTISDAEKNAFEEYKLTNRGSISAFSDGKSMMGQYMGEGCITVSAWGHKPENWVKEAQLDTTDLDACKEFLNKEYHDWDPRLQKLILKADGEVIPRNLYMLPIGHEWKNRPGLTLIGDSAHLMTPFAGEGVNLALEDSMKLADAIVRASKRSPEASSGVLTAEVKAFEEEMFERAAKKQAITWGNLEAMYLTPGAPRAVIEKFIVNAVSDEFGPLLTALTAIVVYMYFSFFKLIY